MTSERMSDRFWFQHESGTRLYPYKLMDQKSGRIAFRVAPPKAEANKVRNQVQLENEEDLYRYVFGAGWSVRMRSEDGALEGMYNKSGYSIVTTSEAVSTILSVETYRVALESADISERERTLLAAHYYAIDHLSSMEGLASAVGYATYAPVNLQYGKLARKVAESLPSIPLDVDRGEYGNLLQAIAAGSVERSQEGHFQWMLRPELVAAMEELGWVSPDDTKSRSDDAEPEERLQGGETTRSTLIEARRGQGLFRRRVLQYWGGRCAVTGCASTAMLVASHIKPWASGSDDERLDGFNGLLLTPNLDRLFDSCLISFSDDGGLLLSPSLSPSDAASLGVNAGMRIERLHNRHRPYLDIHRRRAFPSDFPASRARE